MGPILFLLMAVTGVAIARHRKAPPPAAAPASGAPQVVPDEPHNYSTPPGVPVSDVPALIPTSPNPVPMDLLPDGGIVWSASRGDGYISGVGTFANAEALAWSQATTAKPTRGYMQGHFVDPWITYPSGPGVLSADDPKWGHGQSWNDYVASIAALNRKVDEDNAFTEATYQADLARWNALQAAS